MHRFFFQSVYFIPRLQQIETWSVPNAHDKRMESAIKIIHTPNNNPGDIKIIFRREIYILLDRIWLIHNKPTSEI